MRIPLLILLLTLGVSAPAQYENDNKKYTTVYPEDLCRILAANPGFLLLDVRSQGEFGDSSGNLNLNIGRLQGAYNISVQELGSRLQELSEWKDRPVFVYCSHSQRSRRASTMLADSGFHNVYNINGGLTTLQLMSGNLEACNTATIEDRLSYQLVTPATLDKISANSAPYFIIDIRPDSVFKSISSSEKRNAWGRFSNATNIPLNKLDEQAKLIRINKPVLLIDDNGNDSPRAVEILKENGFDNVTILFGGMERWTDYRVLKDGKTSIEINSSLPYKLIAGEQLPSLLQGDFNIIDIRIQEEFNAESETAYRNQGRLINAKNIPIAQLREQFKSVAAGLSPHKPILLYGFGTEEETFEAARIFVNHGYRDVNVLLGGIFNLRWKAANLKGREELSGLVAGVGQ